MTNSPKIKKPRKPLTLIQKVCLQRGQDEFSISNSYCLIKFLKENDCPATAAQVERAIRIAKATSQGNYINNRIKLDPNWLQKQREELNKDG